MTTFDDIKHLFPVLALPAIEESKSEKYSQRLKSLFTITSPTCEEYERLNRHIGVNDISGTISRTTVIQNRKYEISIFKEIGDSLKNEELFPMHIIEG